MEMDSEYMNKREQNYMFAYHIVPSLIFSGDFARSLLTGKYKFQGSWNVLAALLPSEQRVSKEDRDEDDLIDERYQLSDGVYCLLLNLPPAERYLEVQFIAIVFQPKLRCFVAGRSGLEADSKDFSVREVFREGHGKCGHLRTIDAQGFLEEVNRILGLPPNIRPVDAAEFAAHEANVETFVEEHEKFSDTLGIAAAYSFISNFHGSTAGYPASAVAEFLHGANEELQNAVVEFVAFILDNDQSANEPNAVSA